MNIQSIQTDDIQFVSKFIKQEFKQSIAPDCDKEAQIAYMKFISSTMIQNRLKKGSEGFVAVIDNQPIGYLEFRNDHIGLLFVKNEFQQQGIARQLFQKMIELKPETTITANSSRFAENIYVRLGFTFAGEQTIRKGIPCRPMIFKS